ncbi:phosphatase PAP2 family protein [Kaistia adipata]|uniref:phosphatase PAP2 family protein n=1 Tax=Kaistia adipata TaxID=166954 RepID=UPI000416328C|nr:phosphatase PAP2 family protein [Kaistia adipata]
MSLRPFTILVTSFGGQAVILPILVLVTLTLLVAGQRRAAFWWAFSVALVLGLLLVAKIAFIPCGDYLPVSGLRSPSGHAGAAMAVYGGLGVLMARLAASPPLRLLVVGSGVLLALAIAVTRVVIGAHTVPETILGTLIGLIAPLVLLSRRDLFVGPVRLRWIWLFAGPVVLIAIFHGFELGAEHVIERIAYQLNGLLGVCR